MINMFRPKLGYAEQYANITEKVVDDFDKSIFKWLKEDYNFVYMKTMRTHIIEKNYTMTTFIIPSIEKLPLDNEIDLQHVREVLIKNKIDYKNLTIGQLYSAVLFRF